MSAPSSCAPGSRGLRRHSRRRSMRSLVPWGHGGAGVAASVEAASPTTPRATWRRRGDRRERRGAAGGDRGSCMMGREHRGVGSRSVRIGDVRAGGGTYRGGDGGAADPRARQLRQLRVQPRAVPRRARRRAARVPQRRPDGRRGVGDRARRRAALTRPGPSRERRHPVRRDRSVRRPRDAGARRVSRPPGDRARVRRRCRRQRRR